MSKRNHFSDKFADKSSGELNEIISGTEFQKDAKIAAIWELERREEATDDQKKILNDNIIQNEKKEASRLSGLRYQTFWLRFFAAWIDGFVLIPIGFLFDYLGNSEIGFIIVAAGLLNNLSPYIYSVLLHGNSGQTLGKMAMGVKVVDADTEEEIDLRQALIRDSVPIGLMIALYAYIFIIIGGQDLDITEVNIASLLPMLFLGMLSIIWTLVEIFSMLFNEKSRAVHDLIAGTVVVRKS